MDKNLESNNQNFISEGYLFLSNLSADFPKEKWIKIFPFLEIRISDLFGETKNSPLDISIKSFEAKLYVEFSQIIIDKIKDIKNRNQTEEFIKPILEVYLLSYCLIFGEPAKFSFTNTLPIESKYIPSYIEPLQINEDNSKKFLTLWSVQELIIDGKKCYKFSGKLKRKLSSKEDLGNPRFNLVSHGFRGAFMYLLNSQYLTNIISNEKRIVKNITSSIGDKIIIKSLDFLKRALVLERIGFYNEAYLNYFRVIEAFAEGHSKKELYRFFKNKLSLSEDKAKPFILARHRVVAHGDHSLDYLREVGQGEIFKIKEYVLQLLRERLL